MKTIYNKTSKMLEVEQRFDEPAEELLRRFYVDEHKSVHEIASIIGTTYAIAHKWLKLAGIYSRQLNL